MIAALLGLLPVEHYLRNRSLEEWMIYRLTTCSFLGLIGFMLLSSAALAQHMTELGPRRRDGADFWPSLAARLFEGKALATLVLAVDGNLPGHSLAGTLGVRHNRPRLVALVAPAGPEPLDSCWPPRH